MLRNFLKTGVGINPVLVVFQIVCYLLRRFVYEIKFSVPSYVQKVARILSKEGYDVYLVGGAIRDIAMGKQPDDYDLATNAC